MIDGFEFFVFRVLTGFVFLFWFIYWRRTALKANIEKPKEDKEKTLLIYLKYFFLYFFMGMIILQLLGYVLFPLNSNEVKGISFQIVGLMLILLGSWISISARKALGANWTHAFEYQIKADHELVTTGVYAFIRHPIYTGLILAFIGSELLFQSYMLFAVVLIIPFSVIQMQAEEKLLGKHFGVRYLNYKKRTKMIIPFLW